MNKSSILSACARQAAALGLLATLSLNAADWPKWRGPNGDGISPETGWNAAFKDAPKMLWKAGLGLGYPTVSVSEGRVFTLSNKNNQDTLHCFEALTGKEIWKHFYDEELDPKYYDGGPSATPVVEGDKVYSLSKKGLLICLEAASGKIVWQAGLAKQLGVEGSTWGYAGSPVMEGNMILLNVGAHGAAIDKATGKTIWSSGKSGAGYASVVPFDFKGKRQAAVFTGTHLVAVDVKTGEKQWEHRWKTDYDVNSADPIIKGTQAFISSGYGTGCAVIDFSEGKPKEVWRNKEMRNQISNSVLLGDHIYGIDGQESDRTPNLKCIEFATGKTKWAAPVSKTGSIMIADGKIISLSGSGELLIAEATPNAFREIAKAQVIGGKCWSQPVLANGLLYVKSIINGAGELRCLDLRKTGQVALNGF